MTIQENVPFAPLTTLQVGGAARYFAELREKMRFVRPRSSRKPATCRYLCWAGEATW